MAMEYIYIDEEDIQEAVALSKNSNLRYTYDSYRGILKVVDRQDKQRALFRVKDRTCYVLQHHRGSAIKLHEVKMPRPRDGDGYLNVLAWLFGFGNKQYCDNRNDFLRMRGSYQTDHPESEIVTQEIHCCGTHLAYAFEIDEYLRYQKPVAYYYKRVENNLSWASNLKETQYEIVAQMHAQLGKFAYPLQFVIYLFDDITMSYHVETKDFFRKKLRYDDKGVYFASATCRF